MRLIEAWSVGGFTHRPCFKVLESSSGNGVGGLSVQVSLAGLPLTTEMFRQSIGIHLSTASTENSEGIIIIINERNVGVTYWWYGLRYYTELKVGSMPIFWIQAVQRESLHRSASILPGRYLTSVNGHQPNETRNVVDQ